MTMKRDFLKYLVTFGFAAVSLTLTGCNLEKPGFKGMDLTGASYGKGFELDDSDGKRRSLQDFKGKLVLLFFGFTQCPDVCPSALTRAVEVRRLLGDQANLLQVVLITVDPERDTALVMSEYVKVFDPSFIGLRADLATTRKVADDFKVYYQKSPLAKGNYTMDHSTFSYVFDQQGQLRLALRHEQSAADVVADLKRLIK
jgi:protein SCO1